MKEIRAAATASHNAKIGRMTKGYAKGGFVPDFKQSDTPLAKEKSALPTGKTDSKGVGMIGGVRSKPRLDRQGFARGGRAKGGKTDVTVIVGQPPQPTPGANPAMPMPPPMPSPAMAPPPMPPPRPPMVPPPGAAPPGGMPPAGMPIRKHGGRIRDLPPGGDNGMGRLERSAKQKKWD